MRRTQERSQRVEQRQKRWSWGGLTDSEGRTGTFPPLSKNLLSEVTRKSVYRKIFSCYLLEEHHEYSSISAQTGAFCWPTAKKKKVCDRSLDIPVWGFSSLFEVNT